MGLIRPSSGRCTILGHPVPSHAARQKLGFLPEAPYFYDYLSSRELLDLTGRLCGLDARERKRRGDALLERVGLGKAADRPMRKYSKGMLQRAGLAQALINDPDVLVLDEPMSGLDPIGRAEVRALIEEEAQAGKTVFFSTHILPDVEAICDRVAIISEGVVIAVGAVGAVLAAEIRGADVVLEASADRPLEALTPAGGKARRVGHEVHVIVPKEVEVDTWVRSLDGVKILAVSPRKESLEELYMRVTRRAPA
jgi:ABC-2 type transport system ATP-binding protein